MSNEMKVVSVVNNCISLLLLSTADMYVECCAVSTESIMQLHEGWCVKLCIVVNGVSLLVITQINVLYNFYYLVQDYIILISFSTVQIH